MKTLEEILTKVCSLYGVEVEDVKSRKTNAEISLVRTVYCNVAKKIGWTNREIGELINRTKGGVSYALYSSRKDSILYKRGLRDLDLMIERDFLGRKY